MINASQRPLFIHHPKGKTGNTQCPEIRNDTAGRNQRPTHATVQLPRQGVSSHHIVFKASSELCASPCNLGNPTGGRNRAHHVPPKMPSIIVSGRDGSWTVAITPVIGKHHCSFYHPAARIRRFDAHTDALT